MLSEIGAMFEAENGIIIRFGFINSNSYLKQKKTLSLERELTRKSILPKNCQSLFGIR